ncbi:SAF domain-containing protein [Candidatus Poriferisodalis sp.]|uniref:SAF domain-containing protein n=1 Tax=Candidatus Poriferisodalis sp. TaxID=3101277 RepID=UPI003B01A1C1
MSDLSDGPSREASGQPRPVIVPGGAKKRNGRLLLAGCVLVAGAAFGFWYVLQSVDQRQPYVVAARDIARWDQVSSADFRLVEANVGEGAATTAGQMGAIYGQWATGPIPAGTFIMPGMFRPPPLSSEAEASSVVIQVSLPAEDVSYGTLQTGDTIALIGRERLQGAASAFGAEPDFDAPEPELSLIGVLRLDNVVGGNLIYVVEPARALQIQRLVDRYLISSDRQIWRLGLDLTADDIQRALSSGTDVADDGNG